VPDYSTHQLLQMFMASLLFLTGWLATGMGLLVIISRDIRKSVSELSVRSASVSQKALLDVSLAPSLESASQLVDAINRLIRTAVGVGAFLCLIGMGLCIVAFVMMSGIAP
jgi:hypothetical protein